MKTDNTEGSADNYKSRAWKKLRSSLFALRSFDEDERARRGRAAFSLVEMLVVVLVIGLLAGMTVRVVGVIGRNNEIASSRAIVERVAMACEEFKAIYGKYPPVPFYPDPDDPQPTSFEYAPYGMIGGSATTIAGSGNKNTAWGDDKGETKFFTFGLASFFLPRYNGIATDGSSEYGYPMEFAGVPREGGNKRYNKTALKQFTDYNKFADGSKVGDPERDLAAVRRILPILGGHLPADDCIHIESSDLGKEIGIIHYGSGSVTYWGQTTITNRSFRLRDSWHKDLRYASLPPYETFEIRSAGPDGAFDTRDDIVAGKE